MGLKMRIAWIIARTIDLQDYLAFDEAGSLEVEFHAPKMIYV